jgi:hypothetical protein
MFYLFVALVGLFPFTFASPILIDYTTGIMDTLSNGQNTGNKLVFCHFMASHTFISLNPPNTRNTNTM